MIFKTINTRTFIDKIRIRKAKQEGKLYYTLGSPESYEKALHDDMFVEKVGRTDDYPGGCVFKTPREAKRYSKSNKLGYKVYGLIVENPKRDIDFSTEDYFRLIKDSIVVKV